MDELRALLDRHGPGELTATAVPGLTLTRARCPTELTPALYYPLFCVIVRGGKRVFLGQEEYHYSPGKYLIASVDLPVTGQVVAAPFQGLTLALQPTTLAALVLELPPLPAGPRTAACALAVNALEPALLDSVTCLVRLLDTPADIPVLAPLLEREILYRLLRGPQGAMLRELALPTSRLAQISRIIQHIKQRYEQPQRMGELARLAGMSAPSFHRHFRAVTAMSPLQFQKQIRLQMARQSLLAQETDAAHVSFAVGYESPSQFSREYRRLFGVPPMQDAARHRHALTQAAG